MKIYLLIAFVLFLLIISLKVKSRKNKIETYKTISNEDKDQHKDGNKKEEVTHVKDFSHFIKLPLILCHIVYFKLLITSLILIITAILVVTGVLTINQRTLSFIGLTVLITTLYLPKITIKRIIVKRTEFVLKSLPFFIDITAACVQSGMTIDSSLSYAARKFKLINADVSFIMLKMTKRGEINGLESAIKELHQCSSAIELRMFCSALQYSISFGSTVYDQLTKLSQDIREMQLLVTEEKISKLSAKLTIPLFLFILIPFIVLVISPSILEIVVYVQKN